MVDVKAMWNELNIEDEKVKEIQKQVQQTTHQTENFEEVDNDFEETPINKYENIKVPRTVDEIQAQIDIIREHDLENFCEGLVEKLEQEKLKRRSIIDIEECAFDAGRALRCYDDRPQEGYVYKTFEDYNPNSTDEDEFEDEE